ncbi:MAG: glycosyltransferase family 2 protein [Bacteroidia bacterium]|nr:glycosyltransferase family 2 protein [Bacteroidia bacterium]
MHKFDSSVFLSIVVSVYNEQDCLAEFYATVKQILEDFFERYEIIFVNDGSEDNTYEILNAIYEKDKSHVRVIHFSRNFGHEAAMIAGIDHAYGNYVICLDADLQHPPQYIPQMVQKSIQGYEIVLMKRNERADQSWIGKTFSNFFYKVLNSISEYKLESSASDFFLITKEIKEILRVHFRHEARFLRGYIQMIGYRKTFLKYDAPARAAGKSKYNYKKLVLLSIDAIIAFSNKPLNLGIFTGIFIAICSILVTIYSIVMYFIDRPVSGYTTLAVLISFLFSVTLIVIGIVGKYIGCMFSEIKSNPIYIIQEIKENDD